jgi:aspartate ammonia-lyase
MGDVLSYSGALRRLAVEVNKVASDLRLLSMGPRAGLSEIRLPAVQPGSSIMPGKVNPSVPEMVNQVCYQVIGCDAAVLAAADAGQLELNVMMPVIAWNALHASRILANAMRVLQTRCVQDLEADAERARELLDRSTAVATALSPYIGYAATAEVAKASVQTGTPVRDLVRKRKLVPAQDLDAILSAEAMTSPGIPGENQKTDGASTRPPRARGAGAEHQRGRKPAAAPARTAVPAGRSGTTGGTGSRRVAAAGSRDGRAGHRRGQRRR